MSTVELVFLSLQTILFILIILFALIYSIPIIFLTRFHRRNNILTLNVCVATIFCCAVWLPDAKIFTSVSTLARWKQFYTYLRVLQTLFTIQVPFSFVLVSIHRYCSIVYRKQSFFKTKRWIVLCIASQWSLGTVLAWPDFTGISLDYYAAWKQIHAFVSIAVIPSIIFLITNTMIYYYVRSSSRRIQPEHASGRRRSMRISPRDLHLLRHMILMFCIFVGGWAPSYLLPVVSSYTEVNPNWSSAFSLSCELALLLDVIDLYLYNHQMRNYLQDLCLGRCR